MCHGVNGLAPDGARSISPPPTPACWHRRSWQGRSAFNPLLETACLAQLLSTIQPFTHPMAARKCGAFTKVSLHNTAPTHRSTNIHTINPSTSANPTKICGLANSCTHPHKLFTNFKKNSSNPFQFISIEIGIFSSSNFQTVERPDFQILTFQVF